MLDIVKQTLTEDAARIAALLIMLGITAYLYSIGKPVSSELLTLDGVVLGYYFGRGVTNGKTTGVR